MSVTGRVLQVNIAVPERSTAKRVGTTGINKQPVTHPVAVAAPGGARGMLSPQHASGVAGDQIFDIKNHGGDDQAVYAYAREDYDWWEKELGRTLPGGIFGENLTTEGIPVNGALIGETWQIGATLVLQTTFGRVPCSTFQAKMGEPRWVKRFADQNLPGAYFRVVTPGNVQAGDEIRVLDRPDHGVTISEGFHAWMRAPDLLAQIADLEGLPESLRAEIRHKLKL
ncbi:MOSC domain-containing protein [Winogradskya consettensis]|uniref:Sulfurase n=1 Tax=Winogradskya consettensis TaxID=113560 RepID=A0A919VLC5_9ACTN|nr:MOSC domain-containing protein [Actinoplanes consettensis]GIM67447.1 sulfurase [Actinoplanes consettensis]